MGILVSIAGSVIVVFIAFKIWNFRNAVLGKRRFNQMVESDGLDNVMVWSAPITLDELLPEIIPFNETYL